MKAISVLYPARFLKILVANSKNASRDPIFVVALIMSMVPVIAFVLGPQAMDEASLPAFGLANFSAYLAPVVLVLPAALIGWVTGFLILEDRDDGLLLALDITPPGKQGFTLHRATVTFALTLVVTLFAAPQVLAVAMGGVHW